MYICLTDWGFKCRSFELFAYQFDYNLCLVLQAQRLRVAPLACLMWLTTQGELVKQLPVWTLIVAPSQDVKEKKRLSMIVSKTARPGKCLQHLCHNTQSGFFIQKMSVLAHHCKPD